MMVKFAEDLHEKMLDIEAHTGRDEPRISEDLVIDVGLTKLPYYNDKSVAIEENKDYAGNPMHIHLTGFDTYTRLVLSSQDKLRHVLIEPQDIHSQVLSRSPPTTICS